MLKTTTETELKKLAKKKQIKNFKGVFAIDDDALKDTINHNECGIINMSLRKDGGSHWVCYYNNEHSKYIIFCDSFGVIPDPRIRKHLKTSKKKILYNTQQFQDIKSSSCGQWCIYVLDKLDEGKELYDIISDYINDNTLINENKLRNSF